MVSRRNTSWENVVEKPLAEGTVERFTNKKMVVERSVVEDIVNKKVEIYKLLFKWLGTKNLW